MTLTVWVFIHPEYEHVHVHPSPQKKCVQNTMIHEQESLFLTITVVDQLLSTSDHLCPSQSLLSRTQGQIDNCQQQNNDPFNQWKTGAKKNQEEFLVMI